MAGDVETIAGRIAAARSWAYIANRADWMADPAHWADRTRALEERLSDALHDRLTQRFVDRRTTVLMRQLGADASALAVTVADDGSVLVEDQLIGRLEGFRFVVAADARASDKRLLLAAAEKRLGGERARRGGALAEAAESALSLAPGDQPAIVWSGWTVGVLKPGASLARPRIELDRALDCLDPALRERVRTRLEGWVAAQLARHVAALVAMEAIGRDPTASAPLRVVAATLVQGAGLAARLPLGDAIDGLQAGDRQRLRKAGIVIGALDLFDPRLLKPGAARWRQALIAARSGASMPPLPLPGATVLARGVLGNAAGFGFREIGGQAVRVDLVERIARAAHEARAGKAPFAPDSAMATSIGLAPATMDRLMAQLGFRAAEPEAGVSRWVWRGRPARVKSAIPAPRDNAFAALRHLTSGQQG